jgi:hypothetical protein
VAKRVYCSIRYATTTMDIVDTAVNTASQSSTMTETMDNKTKSHDDDIVFSRSTESPSLPQINPILYPTSVSIKSISSKTKAKLEPSPSTKMEKSKSNPTHSPTDQLPNCNIDPNLTLTGQYIHDQDTKDVFLNSNGVRVHKNTFGQSESMFEADEIESFPKQ